MIIGGTACDLLFSEFELEFRATKDIDIVLIVESLTPEFGKRFWKFVEAAGYDHRNKSNGEPQFYRFEKPRSADYPAMIELFTRSPDQITLPMNAVLTPIQIGDEILSLSAILLNDDYYAFLNNGIKKLGRLPVLDAPYLIPFKMRAWLDLTQRKADGLKVDQKNIRKHRNDVFRLSNLLSPETRVRTFGVVFSDVKLFLEKMTSEEINLVDFNVIGNKEDVLRRLSAVYCVDQS